MIDTIIPAIMPTNLDDLSDHIASVVGVVTTVQVDIMDGIFVPEKTWPYLAQDMDDDFIFERGLPYADKIDIEFDLMIHEPETRLEYWMTLAPKRIIFHIKSLLDPERLFAELEDYRDLVEIGISFDIRSALSDVELYIPHVDFVQCMGIVNIGFQGEKFDERALTFLSALREAHPSLILSVDGGVNLDTIKKLKDSGANRFVCGSAIFSSGDEDPQVNIKNLYSRIK